MFDASTLQHRAQLFRTVDRDRADQRRLAFLVQLFDFLNNGLELFALSPVDHIGILDAAQSLIGRNGKHVELVDLHEFFRFGFRCTGHAGQLFVHAEVILECDRGECLVLLLDAKSLFGFNRLMEAVAPAAARHQAPCKFVDDHHFAILHHVLHVALEKRVRLERLVDVVEDLHVRRIEEVVYAEQALGTADAFFSQRHGAMLLVNLVIDISAELRNDLVDAIVLVGGFFARTGNDEGRSGFVNQDRVHFVDDRVMMRALDTVREVEFHVVAQIIEAELVIRPVGNVRPVGVAPLLVIETMLDHADTQPEKLVKPAHPFRIAAGQVIVDRDNVDALARQRVQVRRQRRDQGFTFTGLHFRNSALVKHVSADELHVEMPHIQDALTCFADNGENFRN